MIDLVAELEALLVAWRKGRTSELAAMIDELGSWFDLALPRLPGKTRKERHAAWLALEKHRRVVDVGELLRTTAEGTSLHAVEQLDAIVEWKPDPRTTSLARRLYEGRPILFATSSGNQKVWRRLFDVLEHHADPRALALLADGPMKRVFSPNDRGMKMRSRAVNVRATIEAVHQVATTADQATIERITRELASGRALRDAVRMHRDEEGEERQYGESLLVYRDWLMERGFTPNA